MKKNSCKTYSAWLAARVLLALGIVGAPWLATAAQPPQIIPRPLTPGEKTTYGLPSTMEVSGGLTTVGVGQPYYLELEVDSTMTASNVVWSITSQPINSTAVLTNSPLG